MMLFGKELTSFTSLNEVSGISHAHEQVETRSIGLVDQVGGCGMAATLAVVDLS
jgi:hypothetical protein